MTATTAAYSAFRRAFDDPAAMSERGAFESRQAHYQLLWYWYKNSAYDTIQADRLAAWTNYKVAHGLYRHTRSIYNPTRRLVNFYAYQVYPGVLSEDGATLPDGVPLAIPFAADIDPALRSAIAQFWQWSNWQAKKSVLVRYGACTGDVLATVEDDLERRKITAEVHWPGRVHDLDLDATDNVKAYALEYQSYDEVLHCTYTYRKDVNADEVSYYRDGKPFDYGGGTSHANEYGFVPAVWVKHTDEGGDHGTGVITELGKFDEINSLAAHIHDQIHKVIAAPRIVWTKGRVGNLFANDNSEDIDAVDKDSMLLLRGQEGGSTSDLFGNLPLADSLSYIKELLSEIERDHPELTMFQQLRSMSQVTGPGASRMLGDVTGPVMEAQANYDNASVKLFQMATAIGGYRANRGDWGRSLSRQQAKFLPFNLDSYSRGDLDFTIMPRPLIPLTAQERIDLDRQGMALDTDRRALTQTAVEAQIEALV